MGWSDCGTDSKGRPIGYGHQATCDHPGCEEVIDRGLGYACGGMHGEDEHSCDGYFCGNHASNYIPSANVSVCDGCAKSLTDSAEWVEDEDGDLVSAQQGKEGGE